MAISKRTLRLLKWVYWIVALFCHLYLCYQLFTLDRPIAGVVWLILGLVLLVVMYIYYFPPGDSGSSWPPYITTCPDYLTAVTQTGGKVLCMDYVGLNITGLKKTDPNNPPRPSDSDYPQYIFDPAGNMSRKIQKAQARGLTWQGLF